MHFRCARCKSSKKFLFFCFICVCSFFFIAISIFSSLLFAEEQTPKKIPMQYIDTEEDIFPNAFDCSAAQVAGETKYVAGFTLCHIGRMIDLYQKQMCTMHFIGRQQNGDFEADLIKFGEKMELECRQVIYKIKTITEVVKKEKSPRNSTKYVVNDMAEMYRRMHFFKKSFPLLKIDIGELGLQIASDAIKKIGLRPCLMLISLPGPILSIKKFIEKMKQTDYLLFASRSYISDRRLVHKIERAKLRLKIHEEIQKKLQPFAGRYNQSDELAELLEVMDLRSLVKSKRIDIRKLVQHPLPINERRVHVRSKMYNLSFVHRNCTQRSNNFFSYTAFWKFNFFYDRDA